MSNYDWRSFEKKIYINASVPEIYRCLATAGGMESWFLRKCLYSRDGVLLKGEEEVRTGDCYTFLWHGWSDEVAEKGHILEVNGKDTFGFTFDGNGSTNIKVRISLTSEKGFCCVKLKQYDMPEDEKSKVRWHVGCLEGWLFYMVNLKSVVEGGIDLRNKDMSFTEVINA